MSELTPLQIVLPDGVNTTIQSAINAAAVSQQACVWIPSNYRGTDTYTNPLSVPIFDMRYPGSINFSGSTTNAALKPTTADGIQWVTADGDDSADGLSFGSAKLTIMAAYDALPSSGGTIYIVGQGISGTQWPAATSTSGQGIWIMGSGDPNYASPPAGWRKAKNGANVQVSFIGISSSGHSANALTGGLALFTGGDATHPAIQLSGVTGVSFANLATQYPKSFAWIGVNSNGVKNDAAGGSNIVFENCGGNVNSGSSSLGPVVDIGPNCFWVRFSNCAMNCNSFAQEGTSNRAAIYIAEGTGNTASAILYFENCHFTGGGGIRYENDHIATANHFIQNCEAEGTGSNGGSQPLYEVLSSTGTFFTTYIAANGISDAGSVNSPRVKVAVGVPNWAVTIFGNGGFNNIDYVGPMNFRGLVALSSISTSGSSLGGIPIGITNPQAQNQKGSFFAKSIDQGDWLRRAFSPSLVRFTNLANQLPANWIAVGAGTITDGQTAPDGTLHAGLVTGADAAVDGARCFESSRTFNAGDYMYFGVWARATVPNFDDTQGAAPGITFVFGDAGLNQRLVCGSYGARLLAGSLQCPTVVQDDGSWQWVWGVIKCTTGDAVSYSPRAFLPAQTGHSVQYYAPIFCHITAASVQTVPTTSVDTAGNSGATESGHICTIKTTGAHGLVPGMYVCIKGVTASGYNGEFVVRTTPTTTTFTYYNATTGLSTSGSGSVIPGNDSEVAEWAMNNASYSGTLTAGPTVATARGTNLAFGGSGDNFFAILDHTALTANRTITFPDAAGTIDYIDVAQTISGAKSFNSTKLILKGSASGTTVLNADATAGATTATLPPNTGIVAELNYAQSWTAVQTFGSGKLALAGSTSGSATLNADATAGTAVITLPKTTTVLGGLAQAASWTAAQTFVDSMLLLAGSTSGAITLKSDATAGTAVMTFPKTTTILGGLAQAATWTAAQTFTDATLLLKGSTSGAATLKSDATAGSAVITLPKTTTVLGGLAQSATWTSAQYFNSAIGFGPVLTKTDNYTVAATECILLMNSVSNKTFTLLSTVPAGSLYRLKSISTGTITVAATTGNVDAGGSTTLPLTGTKSLDFHFDGTDWWSF